MSRGFTNIDTCANTASDQTLSEPLNTKPGGILGGNHDFYNSRFNNFQGCVNVTHRNKVQQNYTKSSSYQDLLKIGSTEDIEAMKTRMLQKQLGSTPNADEFSLSDENVEEKKKEKKMTITEKIANVNKQIKLTPTEIQSAVSERIAYRDGKIKEMEKRYQAHRESLKVQGLVGDHVDISGCDFLTHRVYSSTINFNVFDGYVNHNDSVNTIFRIERRDLSHISNIHKYSVDTVIIPQIRLFPKNINDSFIDIASRYYAGGIDFSRFDFAGLVEHLAACITYYSETGTLSFSQLSSNKVEVIESFQKWSTNVGIDSKCVFIPRWVETPMSPGIFCALAGASFACDAKVVTDYVVVDSNNQALFLKYKDRELAYSCNEALRLLGGIYDYVKAGDVFALAYVKGVNRIKTVISHTDEGGFIRGLLRTGHYSVPFGGVCSGIPALSSLPTPGSDMVIGLRKMTDSVILTAAALVSLADPGMVVNDKHLCYVSVSLNENEDDIISEHLNNISMVISDFSNRYMTLLLNMFKIEGNSGLAERYINSNLLCSKNLRSRHLKEKIVAPFFWIEPTGIINSSYANVLSKYACLPICYYDSDSSYGVANSIVYTEHRGNSSVAIMDYTNLRSNMLLTWLGVREQDGLGYVKILGCSRSSFICCGNGVGDKYFTDTEECTELLSMSKLRWDYSDAPIPKPIEALYIGEGLKVIIEQYAGIHSVKNILKVSYNKKNVLPDHRSISEYKIVVSCDTLTAIGWSNIGNTPKGVRRTISKGAMACFLIERNSNNCMSNNSFIFTDCDYSTKNYKKPPNDSGGSLRSGSGLVQINQDSIPKRPDVTTDSCDVTVSKSEKIYPAEVNRATIDRLNVQAQNVVPETRKFLTPKEAEIKGVAEGEYIKLQSAGERGLGQIEHDAKVFGGPNPTI